MGDKEYKLRQKSLQQAEHRRNYKEQREQQYIQSSTFIRQQNRKTLENAFKQIKSLIVELSMYPTKIDRKYKALRSEKASVLNRYRKLTNLYAFSNSLDTLIK